MRVGPLASSDALTLFIHSFLGLGTMCSDRSKHRGCIHPFTLGSNCANLKLLRRATPAFNRFFGLNFGGWTPPLDTLPFIGRTNIVSGTLNLGRGDDNSFTPGATRPAVPRFAAFFFSKDILRLFPATTTTLLPSNPTILPIGVDDSSTYWPGSVVATHLSRIRFGSIGREKDRQTGRLYLIHHAATHFALCTLQPRIKFPSEQNKKKNGRGATQR